MQISKYLLAVLQIRSLDPEASQSLTIALTSSQLVMRLFVSMARTMGLCDNRIRVFPAVVAVVARVCWGEVEAAVVIVCW